MTTALALTAITAFSVPVFAQTATTPEDAGHRSGTQVATPSEGRAATRDQQRSGNPNGEGNALEGPYHAPDATRNNDQ
jgi:hypothetical protein